ncbi:MAG: methyltransferase domain-containing protein [Desulfosarcinaceae bacterium]|nr:methyltransferase domain-containing protein [Desulfosarcinaceae bacterium]
MRRHSSHARVCSHRYAWLLDNWLRRLFQAPARVIGDDIRRGDTVLDIGCGPGFFTLEMARLVGDQGRVMAIDLQVPMLERVARKAIRAGLSERIRLHHCQPDRIGLTVQADFALAYYMVHETPSVSSLLREILTMVRPGGRLLVVEPRLHVRRKAFERMCRLGRELGWEEVGRPGCKGGRSVLFQRRR